MESRLVGRIVLGVLGTIAWLYATSPSWARSLAGGALGKLLLAFHPRAKVVRQNLEIAFPGNEAQAVQRRKRLFSSAYEHLGHLILEVLTLLAPGERMKRYVLGQVTLTGAENWKAAHEQGKGVIFLASHVGNWEIMAASGALLIPGMELTLVTKHLKPEWLHQAIEKGRASCRVKATYEPRTLRDVLAALKKKQTVGFVLDQYAGPPIGVRVPVFGTPVGTTTAIATLAKRTGAPVLPVVNYRVPGGGWRVDIRPALEWAPHEVSTYELAHNTAGYAADLERDIYAHPEQWLWIHRRFKGNLEPLRSDEWHAGRPRHS